MTKVELQALGGAKAQNDNLAYVLEKVKEGVADFVRAIRGSTEEHRGVSFRAFNFRQELQEDMTDVDKDMDNVFAVIMTQVAIELNEIAKDLVKEYTFYNSKEQEDIEGRREYALWLHLQKRPPPTAEEIAKRVKELDAQEAGTDPSGENPAE